MTTRRYSRRDFMKRTGGAGIVAAGASAVGIEGILAAQRAPAVMQEPEVSGVVRMLLNTPPGYLEGVIAAFNEQYPNVTVEAQEVVSEGWAGFSDEISTRIAGGEVYDLVQIATEGQRVFASRGMLAPIDEYLERDQEELQNYFDSVPEALMTWSQDLSAPGDEQYFLPGEFNTMGIWYNADMFAEAGVPEPEAGWTWDDFREAAMTLSEGDGNFGMHVTGGLFDSVMPWLLTNGASPLNEDWSEATVNTPEAIEAAEFMRSLVADGASPEPGGEFDGYTLMAQDRLAMFGAGRWPLVNIRELDIVDKVKIAPWPQSVGPGSPVGWKSYPIMDVSENKEAAWAFAKFMTTTAASEALAEVGTEVPPRQEAIDSDVYLEDSPEGMEIFFEAVEYATPVPGPDNGSIIQQDIEEIFTQILAGNLEAEPALNDLQTMVEAEL